MYSNTYTERDSAAQKYRRIMARKAGYQDLELPRGDTDKRNKPARVARLEWESL